MAHPNPQPHPFEGKSTPIYKGLLEIKSQIDKLLDKMKMNRGFIPQRMDLDKISKKAIDLIQKYHPTVSLKQKTLLAAMVDLTEVPIMHPVMQRIAFETALKDASFNINHFLHE